MKELVQEYQMSVLLPKIFKYSFTVLHSCTGIRTGAIQ